jgi:exodeoxyribonuclease-3
LNKGFLDIFSALDADIFCLQETKLQPEQVSLELPDYYQYWNSADKKGYSGTAIFTREKPLSIQYDFGEDLHRHEGRIITAEYPAFFLVCCYTPNSQDGLRRLSYRMQWEEDLRTYLLELDKKKPVILCGDLNVAHQEIDLKNPSTNRKNPGFTDEEREKMTLLLSSGFSDTFRTLYPDRENAYSWWSYRTKARERNAGWRIDYFIASNCLMEQAAQAEIYSDILGSDHCPVGLILK